MATNAVTVEFQAGLWERKTWVWTRYDPQSERTILAAMQRGDAKVGLRFGAAHSYEIDLRAMTQTNLLSKKVAPAETVNAPP
jgi:hypothetical protein